MSSYAFFKVKWVELTCWLCINFAVSDGYDTCQNNDYQAKEDLFSRKSDESNFIRAEDIDPSKKRLSHIAILLEKLVRKSRPFIYNGII